MTHIPHSTLKSCVLPIEVDWLDQLQCGVDISYRREKYPLHSNGLGSSDVCGYIVKEQNLIRVDTDVAQRTKVDFGFRLART